jgi:hypothetical protein
VAGCPGEAGGVCPPPTTRGLEAAREAQRRAAAQLAQQQAQLLQAKLQEQQRQLAELQNLEGLG